MMRRKISIGKKKKTMLAFVLAVSLALGSAGCGTVVKTTDGEEIEDVENGGKEISNKVPENTESAASEQASENTESAAQASDKEIPRPQDDYYGYINKQTLQGLPINYKATRLGSDMDIQNAVDTEIATMIMDIVNSSKQYEEGSSEQLVKAFYLQAKDFAEGKECGAKEAYLSLAGEINAISDVKDCKAMMKKLAERGIITIFNVNVRTNYFKGNEYVAYIEQTDSVFGFDLKDIYENDDDRKSLQSQTINVLVSAGEEPKAAKEKANDLIYALIDIGRDTDFSVGEAANPFINFDNKTNEELNKILENISIEEIADIYKIGADNKEWLINDETQLKAIDKLFTEEHVGVLKTWMLSHVLYYYRNFLENDYAFIPKEFNVPGLEASEKACLAAGYIMQDQMNELYARYYYTEEMDALITKMFEDIRTSYDDLISRADWLSAEMRTRLRKKLHNMNFVKGGGKLPEPDPENKKLIGKDVFETYVNVGKKKVDGFEELLKKKVDKEESVMASHIVNAAYSPTNTFTIPVAIMHAPYFDVNADYAANMGGLGMVMAHEIGHAFDSNCIVFDENGAYHPETVPEEDAKVLEEEAKKMEDYFSAFSVLKVYHVDGEQTSGENYADKGAMECLMNIVKSKNEREKLFENYAKIWMQLLEDSDVLMQLDEDEHSPNTVRVNGILSSTPEFYEVYDVKEGDGMYIEEAKRVRRW